MPDNLDVNIGIGVSVEGVDQKSLENAKAKIKEYMKRDSFKVALDIDTNSMNQFNATITKLKKNMATLTFDDGGALKEFVVNLKTGAVEAYESAQNAAKRYGEELLGLRIRLSELRKTSPVDEKSGKVIKKLQKKIQDLKKEMQKSLPDDLAREVVDDFDKVVVSVKEMEDRFGNVTSRIVTLRNDANSVTSVFQSWNSEIGAFVTKSSTTSTAFKDVEAQIVVLRNRINNLLTLNTNEGFVNALKQIKQELSGVNVYSDDAGASIKELGAKVTQTTKQFGAAKSVYNEFKRVVNEYAKEITELKKLEGKETHGGLTESEKELKSVLEKNTKELEDRIKKLNEVVKYTDKAEDAEDYYNKRIAESNVAIEKSNAKLDDSKTLLGEFSAGVGDALNVFSAYNIAEEAIRALTEAMREAIEIAKEMNDVFTDIQMVTMGTEESIKKLKEQYGQLAYNYSASITSVAEGANEWLNLSGSL